jgi:quercetin dioxygenase-like cupin family protein
MHLLHSLSGHLSRRSNHVAVPDCLRKKSLAKVKEGIMTKIATPFQIITDLPDLFTSIPAESIVSRTLIAQPMLRVVLFGFAAGQELTEHKTPMAATIQILSGEAELVLGEEVVEVRPGALIYMAPNLPHSVRAHTDMQMVLTMAKAGPE